MMILMAAEASAAEISQVIERIQAHQLNALRLPGDVHVAIGISSAIPPELREPLTGILQALPGVESVIQISRPYKLASREFRQADTIAAIRDVRIGGSRCVVIAGPCSVESHEQIFGAAEAVKAAGAVMLRGGAYKPRTSPYAFQGLGKEGLELLQAAGERYGLATVTEVMSPEDVGLVADHADMLQIGARNMQNYALLVAVGKRGHPTLLKRGPSASLDEFLLAAEYLLHHGCTNVVLCERGIHPLDRTHTRNTLDLNAVPVLKQLTHLPVLVDPSHGTGISRLVSPMARAAIAAGADGLIVEVHPSPREALSDGAQSLAPAQFKELMTQVARVAQAIDRSL
ncbi:MAG: 3-deoxy-7-phosphoheptulonate synthase [Armatimonadetes bacterium]|nr:3-deoxy-7-phosphoheptulonate synthase [Armatimonadota bacterium]MDE2207930.1 3-deoxy-7-phosphoheptulonate synthase [Armatimonadota bacterium]